MFDGQFPPGPAGVRSLVHAMSQLAITVAASVMPELDPHTESCPCQSGRLLANCCVRGDRLFRRCAETRPPLPRTGHRSPGCFASVLKDCSPDITREHYVSAGILRMIGGGREVKVSGATWLKGESKSLRVDSFASNMLCSRHNSALSPLDSAALQLFEKLQTLRVSSDQPDETHRDVCALLVNGHDIERWCLKAMLGGLFSGNLGVPGAEPKSATPQRKFIEFLFGDRAEVPPWGLRVLDPRESILSASAYLSVTVLHVGFAPAGILLQLNGLQIALGPKNAAIPGSDVHVLRPSELRITTTGGFRTIALSWERPWGDAAVVLERRQVKPSGAQGTPGDQR